MVRFQPQRGRQTISLNLNKDPQGLVTSGISSRNSTADKTKVVSQNKSTGWVLDPGSSLSSFVTMGKLTSLSELQFPHLWFRGNKVEPTFQDCCEGRMQHCVQKTLHRAWDMNTQYIIPVVSFRGLFGGKIVLSVSQDAGVPWTQCGERWLIFLFCAAWLCHPDVGGLLSTSALPLHPVALITWSVVGTESGHPVLGSEKSGEPREGWVGRCGGSRGMWEGVVEEEGGKIGLSEDLRPGWGMWTLPWAVGNCAGVFEHSCLLQCAWSAGIYLLQLSWLLCSGASRACLGGQQQEQCAASRDRRYGESVSPHLVLGAWNLLLYLSVSQPPCL